jgi:3-oxoacyl-[acyl-carrier protein] reductase
MNIIVTGAAGGIGCRLVTLLAEAGHAVIATDVDERRLDDSAQECDWIRLRVLACPHDVTNPQSWSDLLSLSDEHFGPLDALVNVAGVLRCEPVHEITAESVALQVDVNTKGVILGTQAAAAAMIPRRRGRIVNIASMAALAPIPGIAVYSASKFAVRGFSLAAAQELEPHGVHVSVVCPDAVDTSMVDYQLDHAGGAMTFSAPRILSVDEVARAIVVLLSGKPRFELLLPRSRGWLAKLSMFFPRFVQRRVTASLTQKGLARQAALRGQRDANGHSPMPPIR